MNSYAHWLNVARRHSRRPEEADDLLQDALLAALCAKRHPLECDADAPWFHGVIANLATARARSAVREKERREHPDVAAEPFAPHAEHEPFPELDTLPDALRRTLVLALSGLDRKEIQRVLGISDIALRQRLTALRKHLGKRFANTDVHALAAAYASRILALNPPDGGKRRAALARGPAHLDGFRFGISDADGNLIAISGEKTSQNEASRQQAINPARTSAGETQDQEKHHVERSAHRRRGIPGT